MAYANIPNVTLANTFDEWRNDTNSLVDLANLLVKGDFHKETGNFILDNGTLILSRSNGSAIIVNSDITVANTIWANNIVVTNNQIINGQWLLTSDSVILRSTLPSNGNGYIVIEQGGSNGNAVMSFDSGHKVWKLTSNASNTALLSTILVTANVSDSINSTSSLNVASSLAVNTAYHAAQTAWALAANADQTVTVSANSGSTLTSSKLNFINSPTINVSVTTGTGGVGNANISFSVIGGGTGTQGVQGARGNSIQGTAGIGIQGAVGIQGADGGGGGGGGSQGATGSQGTIGTTGPSGIQGSSGNVGITTSASSNGWSTVSGLTTQWGNKYVGDVGSGGAIVNITFPKAFTTACYTVVFSLGSTSFGYTAMRAPNIVGTPSKTGFTVQLEEETNFTQTISINYIAVGT